MLVTLSHMGVVVLDPPPPPSWQQAVKPTGAKVPPSIAATGEGPSEGPADESDGEEAEVTPASRGDLIGRLTIGEHVGATAGSAAASRPSGKAAPPPPDPYDPVTATPTEKLRPLTVFKAVHPLYGVWLMDYLGKADDPELVQILESLLEMPGTVARSVRVPWPDQLPPGRLAMEVIDPAILTRGLAAHEDLYPSADQSDLPPELRKYPVPLAEKMRMLFESEVDHAGGLFVTPVWAAGDLLAHGGGFDQFVRGRDLIRQEGVLFRHLLRLVLLCDEFGQLTPRDVTPADWQARLKAIADVLTTACRAVDPQSTDELLEELAEES
jgi:hypothetical protein